MLGYRRFEGIAAARGTRTSVRRITTVRQFLPTLIQAGREASAGRAGNQAIPPAETPCARLLQAETSRWLPRTSCVSVAELDPLKLLEEMRAVQAYLAALADGERRRR